MIALFGNGFAPRPISVRKHDRPMRHRKSPTASKMFLFIQFGYVPNDGPKFSSSLVRNTQRNSKPETPSDKTRPSIIRDARYKSELSR